MSSDAEESSSGTRLGFYAALWYLKHGHRYGSDQDIPPSSRDSDVINKCNMADQQALVTENEITQRVEVICSIWVHDENLSREDVLLDVAAFPKDAVRPGDLVEVTALKKSPADEESTAPTGISNISNGAESREAGEESASRSVAEDSTIDGQNTHRSTVHANASTVQEPRRGVSERHTTYVFVAKELSPELKQKYPNLQVNTPSPRSSDRSGDSD